MPGKTSHLQNIFLGYTTLWHYPRRAVHALLVALIREPDFKLILTRCFVQVVFRVALFEHVSLPS